MTMKDILTRIRQRRDGKPARRDWTNTMTPRDWADLPVHHPRREDDAL